MITDASRVVRWMPFIRQVNKTFYCSQTFGAARPEVGPCRRCRAKVKITSVAVYDTNRPYNVDDCHHEVREARRGDPARLLRRSASRNDRLNFKGRWYDIRTQKKRGGRTKRPPR